MKAVIIAGGEGNRMRPLTCNLPKPLLRLCGRENIVYLLDLLYKSECSEVTITLWYLQSELEEFVDSISANYPNMNIQTVSSNECLGTVGSVKFAVNSITEPLLVISGDAFCDFNLSEFYRKHISMENDVSVLLTNVNDPREYGVVTLSKFGNIQEFIEKPGWSRAISSLVNTGIYCINPDVLNDVPSGMDYDFAKNLFPNMLKNGKPIAGIVMEGYWSNICEIPDYLRCQYDVLLRKIKCNVNISETYIGTKNGTVPSGRYKIVPPVYIGENVVIGDSSVVGPYTIVDDNCIVGNNVHLSNSLLLPNVKVESNAHLTGAIVAKDATVRSGAQMYDGAVLGSGSVLGEQSTILQNILVWPKKNIPSRVRVYQNVKIAPQSTEIFDDDGVSGSIDAELIPETCARLGQACASVKKGVKIGIATDGSRAAKVLKMAILSGTMAGGAYIWDFSEAFAAQLPFFTSFCGLDMGMFIKTEQNDLSIYNESENNVHIIFCASDGLPLYRSTEREIEHRLNCADYLRSNINKGRDISSITSIRIIYLQELNRVARGTLDGQSVAIESPNPEIARVLRESLDRLECSYSDKLVFHINFDGTEFTATDDMGLNLEMYQLLAICCTHEFKDNRDVALPFSAPKVIDEIAKKYGRRVLRYFESPSGKEDEAARRLAACQNWSKDALFMSIKLLSIMRDEGKSLRELFEELPEFSVAEKTVLIGFSPAQLRSMFRDDLLDTAFASEGAVISNQENIALLRPSKKGNKMLILAEARTMEAAEEFSQDLIKRLREISENEDWLP